MTRLYIEKSHRAGVSGASRRLPHCGGTVLLTIALAMMTLVTASGEETTTLFEPIKIKDTEQQEIQLPVPKKKATVLLFLSCDCPIANAFAPELNRIAATYRKRGVAFYRVYPASYQTLEDVRQHTVEYEYEIPAIQDIDHHLVRACGARVTPEAVVVKDNGDIVYRGRINDLYTDVGKRRRTATTADLRDALDGIIAGSAKGIVETRAFGCYISLAESGEVKSDDDTDN